MTAGVALALLPALVAVAAAQPVVIHAKAFTERLDAQVFLVFDTSLSMKARSAPDAPTRLTRAKQEATALIPHLGDLPVGVATMTDRVLPNLMPTTTTALALRTVNESVRIDEPPPSLRYHGRASTLEALVPVIGDRLFPPGVKHPILVIFTDGEMKAPPPFSGYSFAQQVTIPPLFVHVWSPTDHIYSQGRVDPAYQPDPTSTQTLTHFASLTHGHVLREGDVGEPPRRDPRRGRLEARDDDAPRFLARTARPVVPARRRRPARLPVLAAEPLEKAPSGVEPL